MKAAQTARIPPHYLTLATEVTPQKGAGLDTERGLQPEPELIEITGDTAAATRALQAYCTTEAIPCVQEKSGALRVASSVVIHDSSEKPGQALHFTWGHGDDATAQRLLAAAAAL